MKKFQSYRVSLAYKILEGLYNESLIEWDDSADLERLVCVNTKTFAVTDISLERKRGSVTIDMNKYSTISMEAHVMIHNHPFGAPAIPSEEDWEFAKWNDTWSRHRCTFYMVVKWNFTEATMYKKNIMPHVITFNNHEKTVIITSTPLATIGASIIIS